MQEKSFGDSKPWLRSLQTKKEADAAGRMLHELRRRSFKLQGNAAGVALEETHCCRYSFQN